MKLEVGMYVRTKRGQIGKITTIGKDNIAIEFNEMWQDIILKENIIKASFDIYDLIDLGDIVEVEWDNDNGKNLYEVIALCDDFEEVGIMKDINKTYFVGIESIKSIVTKEQFEKLSFKVGD